MFDIETGGAPADLTGAALAVPVGADRSWGPGADWAAGELSAWLDAHLDLADFSGKPGQIAVVPGAGAVPYTSVYFVGLGDEPDADMLREAAGNLGRRASRAETIVTTLHQLDVTGAADSVAIGLALGQYRFDKYRSEPKPPRTERVVLSGAGGDAVAAARRGLVVAAGVAIARDLVNEPAGGKPATEMARRAADLGAEVGLRVKVYDEEELAAGGFGGVLGVAAGAVNPPRMVEMWHEPDGATTFLALVGKGIVFDSGGLSIKPAKMMEEMKTDMSGAAAVIGAMRTIAALELPIKVLGLAPLAENMPGGAATRPGDVLKIRNGKTIEVLNTDAEGRLVLADALSLATEHEPDLIVDLATLTGACHVALGDAIAGAFGPDDAVVGKVLAAAQRVGERMWPMPLPADYRDQIDSTVADMKNIGNRYGGAITAALLLKEFVGEIPWVHLDIAGPARASKDGGYIASGGTGFGVRAMVALAEDMAQDR